MAASLSGPAACLAGRLAGALPAGPGRQAWFSCIERRDPSQLAAFIEDP
ncbi:hypothetical protein [Sphaerisporangium sp. NPDC051011]